MFETYGPPPRVHFSAIKIIKDRGETLMEYKLYDGTGKGSKIRWVNDIHIKELQELQKRKENFDLVGCDELTEFTEEQLRFLLGRWKLSDIAEGRYQENNLAHAYNRGLQDGRRLRRQEFPTIEEHRAELLAAMAIVAGKHHRSMEEES